MNIVLQFQEPSGRAVAGGSIRAVAGERAYFHDQKGGRTQTWVHQYRCPMAISAAVVARCQAEDVTLIAVRDNEGQCWMTTMWHLEQAPIGELGRELQYFVPVEYWDKLSWHDLQLKPLKQSRTEYILVPTGTFTRGDR